MMQHTAARVWLLQELHTQALPAGRTVPSRG